MNELTVRFLAYREKPKTAPITPPEPRLYEVEGFLSNSETTAERMGRLVEALARGDILSSQNMSWFKRHRRIRCGGGYKKIGDLERGQKLSEHIMLEDIRCTSRPVVGGFR